MKRRFELGKNDNFRELRFCYYEKNMKRDMDLVRQILLTIEERPPESASCGVTIPEYSKAELELHLRLMEDAGLVQGVSINSSSASCLRMTWHGYEFLETTRKDTLWQKAKEITIQQTGGLSIAALTEALKTMSRMAIEGAFR